MFPRKKGFERIHKYNKHVFLPRNETTEKEALHETRRMAMLDIFRKSLDDGCRNKHKKKEEREEEDKEK